MSRKEKFCRENEHPFVVDGSYRRRLEAEIDDLIGELAPRSGLSRRRFLRSSCGMAATFMALNALHGLVFAVDPAEAADPAAGADRAHDLSRQFIFDAQLHFVHDDYAWEPLLGLRRAAFEWNPELERDEDLSLRLFRFKSFVRQVYLESETDVGLLSSAPSDDPEKWFLHNDQLAEARAMINGVAGSRRLLCHNLFTPGRPGWLDDLDRAIEEYRPDGWKGYTVGDPNMASKYPWRMDDEELVYPAYEKMRRAGIRNVCVHKGILPPNYREKMKGGLWKHARVDDVAKAARDWPDLNFIIYHSAMRSFFESPKVYREAFEKCGYIPWVSELAQIPREHGLENVYAEIGSTFASLSVTHPRHCAVMLGTLIDGMGADKVLWGTDSIWYGSPQWQIEAFRRIEIPADLRERFGFAPLGAPDSPVRNAVFGHNSARLYGLALDAAGRPAGTDGDAFARWKETAKTKAG